MSELKDKVKTYEYSDEIIYIKLIEENDVYSISIEFESNDEHYVYLGEYEVFYTNNQKLAKNMYKLLTSTFKRLEECCGND